MLRVACIAIISVAGCSDEIPRTKPPPREVDLRGIDFDNPLPGDAPRLVALLGVDGAEVAYRAQVALVGIGEPAIPSLIEGLRRQECFFVPARSRRALTSIGPSAIPPLLEVLNDPVYDQPLRNKGVRSIYWACRGRGSGSPDQADRPPAGTHGRRVHSAGGSRAGLCPRPRGDPSRHQTGGNATSRSGSQSAADGVARPAGETKLDEELHLECVV